MRFNGGYLGACIIVLSILLGIAGGLMLNVNETSVSSTKYDYVTDITGLFDTSQEPQYIDYEPATNYTGYTNTTAGADPSGITYTHTSDVTDVDLTAKVTNIEWSQAYIA